MNQTWPFKDLDSLATKGRFFPVSFRDATRAVNRWKFQNEDGDRVRVCFVNPDDDESKDFVFAEYKPESVLNIYSWADSTPETAARIALAKAFPIFAPLKRIRVPNGQINFSGSYLLRFQKDGNLKLTECRLHFQQGKYSGAQKFSTAFKKRVTRVDEKILSLFDSIEPDFELITERQCVS